MSCHLPHEMFQNQTALLADFQDFEQKIQALAAEIHLDLSQYEIDHLSLRVNYEQTANTWLTRLLAYGSVLSDNLINGRVIYLIQLHEPLRLAQQWIDVVELPFPKDKHYPQETWEHIEVVVPFLPNETAAEWLARIKNTFFWNQPERFTVKTSESKGDGEKLLNLSVAVSFLDKTQNPSCIKFHPYSIKQIVSVV